MRVRVLLEPRHGVTYAGLLALARACEDAGFEGFFRGDHLYGVDPQDRMYHPTDSWTTLAGLARDTRRIRLGTLLTAGTFRAPGLLAVIAATAADMSGGRVELGLGAGWYAAEHAAYGIAFPDVKERFDRLEESLEIITGLWATPHGERYAHTGPLFTLDGGANPLACGPAPPLIIGGAGPRRTPELAARYADEFNAAFPPDAAPARYDRFRRACERIGRDPATARMSTMVPVCCGADRAEAERRAEIIGSPALRAAALVGPPAEVTDRLAAHGAAGADTVYLHIYDPGDLDHIALLGEAVLPHLDRS